MNCNFRIFLENLISVNDQNSRNFLSRKSLLLMVYGSIIFHGLYGGGGGGGVCHRTSRSQVAPHAIPSLTTEIISTSPPAYLYTFYATMIHRSEDMGGFIVYRCISAG